MRPVAMSGADVTITAPGQDPVVHTGVSMVVRRGKARVGTRDGGVLTTRDDPVTAESWKDGHRSATGWTVVFADGTIWSAERPARGCGCGR